MTRRKEIIDVAQRLLDEGGRDAVTMRAIASELGIKAPSLYKHIENKHDLEVALIAAGFERQAEAFESAVADSDRPVAAIAAAYRALGLERPHLYRLMTGGPLPRAELPEGLEGRAAAPLIAAFNGDVDRARATWAFAHGMVSLELANRFPPDADLDAAWATGLQQLTTTPSPGV